LAVALAEQPGIVVARRAVRLVGALLALEIALAVATLGRRLARTVLPPKALQARPCLDQRAVNREVLVREKTLHPRVVENGTEELARDLAAQKPVAVLGEYGDVPHLLVDAETNKPAEQQIVV
jgi:hypothetical protein